MTNQVSSAVKSRIDNLDRRQCPLTICWLAWAVVLLGETLQPRFRKGADL